MRYFKLGRVEHVFDINDFKIVVSRILSLFFSFVINFS